MVAVFSEAGRIVDEYKLPTNKKYKAFLKELEIVLKDKFKVHNFTYCCAAIPATVDRKHGIALSFGNLAWKNLPIKHDLAKILGMREVSIENDANLAGLSEALNVYPRYKKVVYLTISTGIGDGIIIDGRIDPDFADSEVGQMILEHEGQIKRWEDFASGRALVERYHKLASQIDDPKIWQWFAKSLASGIDELVAVIKPEVIIIGGGVGAHFHKFGDFLKKELKSLESDMIKMPPVVRAKRPEEAVIYGCYDYIRQEIQKYS